MDFWAGQINEQLPPGNLAAENYYEIKRLVAGLRLPFQK